MHIAKAVPNKLKVWPAVIASIGLELEGTPAHPDI